MFWMHRGINGVHGFDTHMYTHMHTYKNGAQLLAEEKTLATLATWGTKTLVQKHLATCGSKAILRRDESWCSRYNEQNAAETTDLIACTTTTLNSSGISDINEVICFIRRSTLLSLPVYTTHTTQWSWLSWMTKHPIK